MATRLSNRSEEISKNHRKYYRKYYTSIEESLPGIPNAAYQVLLKKLFIYRQHTQDIINNFAAHSDALHTTVKIYKEHDDFTLDYK